MCGPGSGAAAVARLLPRPLSLCAAWSADVQLLFNIQCCYFFIFARGTQRLHVHLSSLVLWAPGATSVCKQKCPFCPPVQRMLSCVMVFTGGYPYHFLRRIRTVHRGEMPRYCAVCSTEWDKPRCKGKTCGRYPFRTKPLKCLWLRTPAPWQSANFPASGYPLRDTLGKSAPLRDRFKGGYPLRTNA